MRHTSAVMSSTSARVASKMALPEGDEGRSVGLLVGCPVGASTGIMEGAGVGGIEGYPVEGTLNRIVK